MATQTHPGVKACYRVSGPLGARPWWGRWLVAGLLGGYLLVAHGCHGDEDNELWARLRGINKQAPVGGARAAPTGAGDGRTP